MKKALDVLVIEDRKRFRAEMVNTIRRSKYWVHSVEDGRKAVTFFQCGRATEVVVVSYGIIPMGPELIRWIKNNHSRVQVVCVLSATHGDTRSSQQKVAEDAGADEVVDEVLVIQELPAILKRIIGPADPLGMR
jgi:DNA-binding response OmpR family regulator